MHDWEIVILIVANGVPWGFVMYFAGQASYWRERYNYRWREDFKEQSRGRK